MAALKPEDAFQEELAKIIIDNLWRVEKYRMKEAQMTNDTYETVESRGRHEQRLLNSMFKARKELKALQTESAEARKAEAQRLEDQAKIKAVREIPVEEDNPFSAEPASGKQPAGFVPHTPENRPASPATPPDPPSEVTKKPVESEKKPAA
jgi:hypothetical protein